MQMPQVRLQMPYEWVITGFKTEDYEEQKQEDMNGNIS